MQNSFLYCQNPIFNNQSVMLLDIGYVILCVALVKRKNFFYGPMFARYRMQDAETARRRRREGH